jgi:hypothetical protein
MRISVGLMLSALCGLSATVGLAAEASHTTIDVSYDYSQVRLRPTYDDHVRGTRTFQLTLSGKNQVVVQQKNSSGKYHSDWTDRFQAGSGANSWRFIGPHQLRKVTDWPQSITTTTITITDAGSCRVHVVDSLKGGFTEYKTPMLSKQQFGFYKQTVYSNLSCSIRNDD